MAGIALAILTFSWWSQRENPLPGAVADKERFTEVVLSGMPKLLERWHEGEEVPSRCPELPVSPHAAPGFYQCNPHAIECWARSGGHVPVTLDGKTFKLKLRPAFPEVREFADGKRHGRWVTRASLKNPVAPWSGLLVDVEVEGLSGHWRMVLDDTCRGVELPQRRYSYGARPERHERLHEMDWDNDGRHLVIDRYLVSIADVNNWLALTPQAGLKLDPEKQRWPLPATQLTDEQRVAFCASQGKRVLEAHLWDAATMQPSRLERPFPNFVVKSWLPWTRDRRGSFFETAALATDWKPRPEDCALAYVKECEDAYSYQPHGTDNVSWIGLYHVLGGTPEEFRNPVEPGLKVKSSSRFLAAADPGHQLGRREEKQSGALTGFRCYREDFP